MHDDFIYWLFNDFTDLVVGMIVSASKLLFKIITFPIWVIPFIYWYFTEWKVGLIRKDMIDTEIHINDVVFEPASDIKGVVVDGSRENRVLIYTTTGNIASCESSKLIKTNEQIDIINKVWG